MRLVPGCLARIDKPAELVAFETWLAQQATLMSIRGYQVDPEAIDAQLVRIGPINKQITALVEEITGLKVSSPWLGEWLEEQGLVIEDAPAPASPR